MFVGFDAYQKAIDSGADLIVIATPPGFRPIHFEYAVKQGKNIFAEKPVATDAQGIRKFLAAVQEAKAKNLKVGIGLQRHHQANYIETVKRIHDGELGDLRLLRTYWNDAGVWVRQRQPNQTEMEYQMRNWYYFVWLCGDHIVEQHIHNLDVANWVMKGHPVIGRGHGRPAGSHRHRPRRNLRSPSRRVHLCRRHQAPKPVPPSGRLRQQRFGTRPRHQASGRHRRRALLRAGRQMARPSGTTATKATKTPIRSSTMTCKPPSAQTPAYNEGEHGAHSTFTAILGRMATYSGQRINWDDAINAQVTVHPDKYAWDALPSSLARQRRPLFHRHARPVRR